MSWPRLRLSVLARILLFGILLPASVYADAGEEAPECKSDTALTQAAGELLLRGGPPSDQALSAALRSAGSDLVGARGLYWRASEPLPREWLSAFARSADAHVVCGYAQSDSGRLLLVAARAGSLQPLTSQSTEVRGTLAPTFRDPELFIADADGALLRIPVSREELQRGLPLSPELVRPLQVQLLAHGPTGPRPIAERVLPAAEAQPLSDAPEPSNPSPALRDRLLALRSERGLRLLRDNRLLQQAAEDHAKHVCTDGRIGHELTPGLDPTRRLRELGLSARRVGETVARAKTPTAAFTAFENSPSHLLSLLLPDFTDAGIGVSTDSQGRHCVVVMLAAWPRYVGLHVSR